MVKPSFEKSGLVSSNFLEKQLIRVKKPKPYLSKPSTKPNVKLKLLRQVLLEFPVLAMAPDGVNQQRIWLLRSSIQFVCSFPVESFYDKSFLQLLDRFESGVFVVQRVKLPCDWLFKIKKDGNQIFYYTRSVEDYHKWVPVIFSSINIW